LALMRISETHIFLSGNTNASLQMRLREAISTEIWSGRFVAGDRLPSTRSLAKHLGIARITVAIAYDDLAADGYLEANPRSGYFVSSEAPTSLKRAEPVDLGEVQPVDWTGRLLKHFKGVGPQAKPNDWRDYKYPFIFGQADQSLFPHDAWRACARRALGRKDFNVIAGDFGVEDDQMLVEQIVKRSLPDRHIAAKPEEVLMTLGAQNSLWVVTQMLFAGRTVRRAVIEDPGYPELREILQFAGVEILPVPVDENGLCIDQIPDDVQAVFVTPSHQAPTGATMSTERRLALMAMAQTRDFIIVEDDYDFEISFSGPPRAALKSYDVNGRVIYLGSFSKSLFPGLRLGYIVAPAFFIQEARGLRTLIARHPPGITQRITAYFLSLGHYNAHARLLRKTFDARRKVLVKALAEHGVKLPADDQSGASVWIEGPPGVDTSELAVTLRSQGVLIEPGAPFFASDNPPKNFIRLSYSTIDPSRIPDGVRLIMQAMTKKN
jgi:GntR family transcriptional regulator/MocR family aminotransferase